MPYVVDVGPSARRSLAHLPRQVQERVLDRLTALAENPRPVGAVALQGEPGYLRVRVGDYRIVYRVVDDARTVFVDRIDHRKDVYRR